MLLVMPKGFSQFEPDTTINKKIYLLNRASIEKEIGDVMPKLNKEKDLPDVYFLSSNGKEYLRLIFLPGGFKNGFGVFEVGYSSSKMNKKERVKFRSFYTEKGVKLGMTKTKFLSIMGTHIKRVKGTYVLKIDKANDPFLEMYNMPIYEAKYSFKNNHLIKFSFGFDYP